jgi:PBSX family phage terminase large subunit
MPISEKQLSYLGKSTHSFNLAVGAVSSGKTFAQILRWIDHCYTVPDGSLLLMSGKTNESLYDNVLLDMEKLLQGDMKVYKQPLRCHIGSKNIEIACADAHNEKSWGRIQGKTVYGWLADEVTQHPKNFVYMAMARCRGDGKIWPKFWTCNPDFPQHYIKTEFADNRRLDVKNWHFTLDDNPILTDEYKDELKLAYSGVYYDRYVLGKWVMAEGAVYPDFDEDVHVFESEIPAHWQRCRGIDYGYTNPFVCLWGAIDHDGRLYIYDEHYQAKTLIKDHAAIIKAKGDVSWSVADHDAQDNAEMRAEGVFSHNAKKDVTTGIQAVSARLITQPDGFPRLFIHKRCVNTIREMGMYRWAEPSEHKNEKEEPVKSDDHTTDALRYMVMEQDKGRVVIGTKGIAA